MRFIDAHCHLQLLPSSMAVSNVIEEAVSVGVEKLIVPATRRLDWCDVQGYARTYTNIYACLGLHPYFLDDYDNGDLEKLAGLVRKGRLDGTVVAVGECGLDARLNNMEQQIDVFVQHIKLARQCNLPIVVHSVKSHDLVYKYLRQHGDGISGLIHGFSGSIDQARKFVSLGFKIGVGGVITRSGATKTRATISMLSLNDLVLETDAPAMSPQGVAAGGNRPCYLPLIFDQLCKLNQDAFNDKCAVSQLLWNNAHSLFRLPR